MKSVSEISTAFSALRKVLAEKGKKLTDKEREALKRAVNDMVLKESPVTTQHYCGPRKTKRTRREAINV